VLYAILKPVVATIGRVWLRLSAVGTELVPRDGPLLLASNHSSLLDPPLIGSVLPRELDYMAKTGLFSIPGFGGLIRKLNAHPVDRTGSDSAALRLALRLLGDGRALLVFPEGTRGAEGRLGPAHAGAGMLAALSGAPVLPVYIQGSGRALPRGAVFLLVFFVITDLHQFLRGYRRFDPPLIEREVKPSDMPPFLKFVVVDIRPLVLRKAEQKYGAFTSAVGDQRPKSATLSSSRARDTLLDEPAGQIGINQTAFSREDGFDKH